MGLHKPLHNLWWSSWRIGVGLLFSGTGGSQAASAVLSCPAAGGQVCDTQVHFSMELSALRTLGLIKHPFLLKYPMAEVAPCLHNYSRLTLSYSQTDPAVLLTPIIVFRFPLQLLEGCWKPLKLLLSQTFILYRKTHLF